MLHIIYYIILYYVGYLFVLFPLFVCQHNTLLMKVSSEVVDNGTGNAHEEIEDAHWCEIEDAQRMHA